MPRRAWGAVRGEKVCPGGLGITDARLTFEWVLGSFVCLLEASKCAGGVGIVDTRFTFEWVPGSFARFHVRGSF